jgi:hypothetical protein
MNKLLHPVALVIQLAVVALLSGAITWMLQDGESRVASQGLTGAPASQDGADEGESYSAAWSVEEARAFDEFELFWLGEEFMGHELQAIIRTKFDAPPPEPDTVRTDSVTFIYGQCALDPAADLSCTAPITLHNDAYCTRSPEEIKPYASGGERVVRGVPAVSFREDDLSLWSADVRVDLQLGDPKVTVEAVVGALWTLDESVGVVEDLPSESVSEC